MLNAIAFFPTIRVHDNCGTQMVNDMYGRLQVWFESGS